MRMQGGAVYLIWVSFIQDLPSLLVKWVIFWPSQQRYIIAVQDDYAPGWMRAEGIIACASRPFHVEALVQHLRMGSLCGSARPSH
jgi:hypothetical protein